MIAALNELDIDAISAPAVLMLERVLTSIPQVLMAALVLVAFYFVGRFVADLVANVLTNVGFNNILSILGLPQLNTTPGVSGPQPITTEPVATPPGPMTKDTGLKLLAWSP